MQVFLELSRGSAGGRQELRLACLESLEPPNSAPLSHASANGADRTVSEEDLQETTSVESGGEARPEAGFRCPVCGARFSDRARQYRRRSGTALRLFPAVRFQRDVHAAYSARKRSITRGRLPSGAVSEPSAVDVGPCHPPEVAPAKNNLAGAAVVAYGRSHLHARVTVTDTPESQLMTAGLRPALGAGA
ncbi:hypothetical protein HPB49_001983 [Dermacentor silvarum]|uniref:Uncharacterized protein n=1 Tax=Dermacentor silvarum TaxID=543639 RepID=A0ACB8D283_DERSI|nr:hypothetical protein HPB49_001983 [Dermacentor silvarum]